MKVKVRKEFELHSNHTAYENDILNLITINQENNSLFIILEKCNHIFNVQFKDEFDANEYLEFNHAKNEVCSKDIWYREDEVNKRLSKLAEEKQKEIDYWKTKCMKLIDKV